MTTIIDFFRSIDYLNVLKMVGLSIFTLLLAWFLYSLTKRLFSRIIDPFIKNKSRNQSTGISFRNYEIMSASRLAGFFLRFGLLFSRFLRYAIYVVLAYATLTVLFSIHPSTKNIADSLFDAVWEPFKSIINSITSYIPNLLRIVVIVIITRFAVRFLKFIMGEIAAGRLVISGFYADWAGATFNLLRFFAYAFMVVMIFPLLPSSQTEAFKGVSVFLGVLISLGSTTVIANVIAGFVLTYMRSFKLGDRVKVGDVLGDIIEKTPFAVRIQTPKKEIVTVPNGAILSSNVVNFSMPADEKDGVILYMTVSVGYDVPWRKAFELLTTAALQTNGVMQTPTPFVLAKDLGDDAAGMELNIYTRIPEEQARIFSDLNKNIRDIFEKEGIDMTVPKLVSAKLSGERRVS